MRRRIVICLGLLLALCLLGDTIAMVSLHRSIRQLSTLVESHRIQTLRSHLASASARVESDLFAHLAGQGRPREQRIADEQRLKEAVNQCAGCHHNPVVQESLDDIRRTMQAYLTSSNDFFFEGDPQDMSAAARETLRYGSHVVRKATDMADRAGDHLSMKDTRVEMSVHRAWLALIVTLAAMLVFAGFVAFHLMRRLTEPVDALLAGIERVRQGNLAHRFEFEADDEFRTLADAFNKAYEDLRAAHEGMLQAEKLAAVGKLAAGVAHEVLNPLASISSAAQLLRRQCTDQSQAEQIDLVMGEIARISRIVRQMLTFSRPAADETHCRIEIPELLEHAATLIGYDPRARRIGITRCFDSDLGPVRGDSERLLLAFTNIMINALDAICADGDRGGTLAISVRRKEDHLRVAFTDDGLGMTEEQIIHASEPFYTTKEPGAGTGLGLWICYQVIQRHNGTIHIDSRLGEGTTVTITLPCDSKHKDTAVTTK